MICMQPTIGDELRHPAQPNTDPETNPNPTPDPTPEQVLADIPTLDPELDPVALLQDYLAADIPLLDLCEIHRLTLPQLERVLAHPFFTQRLAIHARLSAARADAIRVAAQPQAAAALHRIATTPPHSRDERLANESQRKAARLLLRNAPQWPSGPPHAGPAHSPKKTLPSRSPVRYADLIGSARSPAGGTHSRGIKSRENKSRGRNIMKATLLAAGVACCAASAHADELWGVVNGNLYTIDTNALSATFVGDIGVSQVGAIEFDGSGTLYALDASADNLFTINPATGVSSGVVGSIGFGITFSTGLAWDPITDTMFGVAIGGIGFSSQLLSIDRNNGAGTLVGDVGDAAITGLDADNSGQLWGVDSDASDALVRIDKTNGASTFIGNSLPSNAGSFDIGPSGTFWVIDSGILYSVDPGSGAATPQGTITGLETGIVTGLTSIPAPGTAALLLAGLGVASRRRR